MENSNSKMSLSIIIPAYNEEGAVTEVLKNLQTELARLNLNYEIIVVNDGSTDQTQERLEKIEGIKLINHLYNKGYGASIKTGVKNSEYDWLLFFDADNQHNPKYIEKLIEKADNADLIIGKRMGYAGPSIRQPGKKILKWVAQFLTAQKIPDINSGFRLVKKEYFNHFLHILPNTFSISTTSTMAFLNAGHTVTYVPIEINKRDGGKSRVRPHHAITTVLLILRIIMLFHPLKIFFSICAILGLMTLGFFIADLRQLHLSSTTTILFITTVFIFCFGLLADQISAIRREYHQD